MMPLCQEENIKVIARIRSSSDCDNIINNLKGDNSVALSYRGDRRFNFDCVADQSTSQECMFNYCRGLFESFINGYNATIFAYGHTGSGKTYTMTGVTDEFGKIHDPGLIPRGLQFIFDYISSKEAKNEIEYFVKCSFVEIYNEQIYDLLDRYQQKLNLRFNINQEVFLQPLTEFIIDNPKEAEKIFQDGLKNRRVASTNMNIESSRSHAVFTIVLESRKRGVSIGNITRSLLHLVDLAGSEDQRNTKSNGSQLKEAGMINKSLHVLERVIRAYIDMTKPNSTKYVPFRDSKLTQLLKDAIGGNSKTYLIACLHPSVDLIRETWSTLEFASRVKMVKNKAKVNFDICGNTDELRNEIIKLRSQLEKNSSMSEIYIHEGYDSFWLQQFINAINLRQLASIDNIRLKQQLTMRMTTEATLEEIISEIRRQLELKDMKIKYLEQNHCGNESDIERSINDALSKMKMSDETLSNRVRCERMQIEISCLKSELEKMKRLETKSESKCVNAVLKEYYNSIASQKSNTDIDVLSAKDMEIIRLKEDLIEQSVLMSQLKEDCAFIKQEAVRDRQQLETEIVSLKTKLKISNEQRELAVVERRKSLLANSKFPKVIKRRNSNFSDHEDDFSVQGGISEDSVENSILKVEQYERDIADSKARISELEFLFSNKCQENECLQICVKDFELNEQKLRESHELLETKILNLLIVEDKLKELQLENENLRIYEKKTIELNEMLKEIQFSYREVVEDRDRLASEIDMLSVMKLTLEEQSRVTKLLSVDQSIQTESESSDIENLRQVSESYRKEIERIRSENEIAFKRHTEQMDIYREKEGDYVESICFLEDKCRELQEECFYLSGRMEEIERGHEQKVSEIESQCGAEVRRLGQLNQETKLRTDAQIKELHRQLEKLTIEFNGALSKLADISQICPDDKFLFGKVTSSPILMKGQTLHIDGALSTANGDGFNSEMIIEMDRLIQEISVKNTMIDDVKSVLSSILGLLDLHSNGSMIDDAILVKDKTTTLISEIRETVSEKLSIENALAEEQKENKINSRRIINKDSFIQQLVTQLECANNQRQELFDQNCFLRDISNRTVRSSRR